MILSSGGGIEGLGNFANLDQINSSNISTYIAGAAIGSAQIGAAAVNTLTIAGAAVSALEVATAASSLTLPRFSTSPGQFTSPVAGTSRSITITNWLSSSSLRIIVWINQIARIKQGGAGFAETIVDLLENGVIVDSEILSQSIFGPAGALEPNQQSYVSFPFYRSPGNGTRTYGVQFRVRTSQSMLYTTNVINDHSIEITLSKR